MSENHRQYSTPVCRGSLALGTACKICDRCKDNIPWYLDQLAKENERLRAKLLESGEGANAVDRELGKVMRERDEAHKCLRWAHDTLYEINPSNYDHDEVCRLNNASVEVILGIAPLLGEKHGKADAWWHSRIERQRDQLAAATAESDACWKNLVEAGRQRDTLRTKHAAMQEAIVEAVRRAEGYGVGEGSLAGFITATLRPHLPTPEPAPVDPLVDVVSELVEQGGFDSLPGYVDKLRAALSARGIELRKIGEGEARQFRSSDNG